MKKIYFLSTCSTCKRIMSELGVLIEDFEKQDIKSSPMTVNDLDDMMNLSGSYESLFSRKAIKFRELGLADKNLADEDYKNLILKEYTFLKRPVIIVDDKIFVGNAKKTIAALLSHLSATIS